MSEQVFYYVPRVGLHSDKPIEGDEGTSHGICKQAMENGKITHSSTSIYYE